VHISRRTAQRLFAVLVAVAVLSFGLQAAGHWHSRTFEDQHCRVCHFAHSVTVDFSHGNALPLPEVVNRLAVNPSFEPALEVVVHYDDARLDQHLAYRNVQSGHEPADVGQPIGGILEQQRVGTFVHGNATACR